MVGITLTPEQIRSAPLDVRRWIERELAASLGLRPGEVSAAQPQPEHLVACTLEEAAAVLSLIQGMFPVVNVFFELGRQGASVGSEGLEAFRLADILRHTRLQNMSQVTAFLDIINQAVRRVRADPAATLYVLDSRGDCIVAAQTQQNVSRLWHQVIGGPEPSGEQVAQSGGTKAEASAPETGPSGLQDREATRSADAL